MATVNGNPNWEIVSAPPTSKIFTTGVIASSARGYKTLTRSLSILQESSRQNGASSKNPTTDKSEADKEQEG